MARKTTIGTKSYYEDVFNKTIFQGVTGYNSVFSDRLKKYGSKAADAVDQIYDDINNNKKYFRWLPEASQSNLKTRAAAYYDMACIAKTTGKRSARDVELLISANSFSSKVDLKEIEKTADFILNNKMKYKRDKICKLVQDAIDNKTSKMNDEELAYIKSLQKCFRNNILVLTLDYIDYQNANKANIGKNGKELGNGDYNREIFDKFMDNIKSLNYFNDFGAETQKQLDSIAERIAKDIRETLRAEGYLELGYYSKILDVIKDLEKYTKKIRSSEMESMLKKMDPTDKIKAIEKYINDNKKLLNLQYSSASKSDDLYHYFPGVGKEIMITLRGMGLVINFVPYAGNVPFVPEITERLSTRLSGGKPFGKLINNDEVDWGLYIASQGENAAKALRAISPLAQVLEPVTPTLGSIGKVAGTIGSLKSIWDEITSDIDVVNHIVSRSFGTKLKSSTSDGVKTKYSVYSIIVRKMLKEKEIEFTGSGWDIDYTWTTDCNNSYERIMKQSGIDLKFMDEYYK